MKFLEGGEGKQPNLSVVVKAKTCLLFSDKRRDRKYTKPFDKKLVLRQVSSERDLDGCPFEKADVTNVIPSCQEFPSPSWWLSVPQSHQCYSP